MNTDTAANVQGVEPFVYLHRHNRGNGKTFDMLIQPDDHLFAYRDTLLEEIPLYTAASLSAITADRDRLREALKEAEWAISGFIREQFKDQVVVGGLHVSNPLPGSTLAHIRKALEAQ